MKQLFSRFSKVRLELHDYVVLVITGFWYAGIWSWLFRTDTDLLAGSHNAAIAFILIGFVTNVCLSTFFIWLAIRTAQKLPSRLSAWKQIGAIYFILCLVDFFTAWFVAFIWIGPHGRLDTSFAMSSPALLLINTPLRYASRLIGFFGLGGFVWLVIYLLSQKQWFKSFILFSILGLISFSGYTAFKPHSSQSIAAKVVSETTNRPTALISNKKTDLIVFPEFGLNTVQNGGIQSRLLIDDHSTDTAYVGSLETRQASSDARSNTLAVGTTKQNILMRQDKYRLIPVGEDLPFTIHGLLAATRQQAVLDYFNVERRIIPGKQPLRPVAIPQSSMVLGSAVCSSINAPQDYRQLAKQGANIFTNSASLEVFNNYPIMNWQQESLARFMATANNRYFLESATDGGKAFVITNNGVTMAQSSGTEAVDVTVKILTGRTLYTMVGEWTVVLGSVMTAGMVFWWHHKKSNVLLKRFSRK